MHMLRIAGLAGLLLVAPATQATPFLGAGTTGSASKIEELKPAAGFLVHGGYQFDDLSLPLFFEAQYYDSGKVKFDDEDIDAHFRYSGPIAYAGIAIPTGRVGFFWLKAGYHYLKGESVVPSAGSGVGKTSLSDSKGGLALGAGYDWMFIPELGIRFALQLQRSVDSLPGLPEEVEGDAGFEKENVDLVTAHLGLIWRPRLASKGQAAPYTSAPTAYASPTLPPPPVAAAAPTVAVVFSPGGNALSRPGSVLRATPREDADVVQTLAASTPLKLENSVVNATGTWWFVSSDIERGWLRADELVKP